MYNLLSNAVKFTPKQGTITLSATPLHIDTESTRHRAANWKAVRSPVAGVASVSLFAPEWRGDEQTASCPGGSFAVNSVLRFAFSCSMLESRSTNVVSHDRSSERGCSGAPILVEQDGVLKLIGIHSRRGQAVRHV